MITLRIFISSPGDVGREREVAYRIVERVEARFGERVKLEGYFWEHEPMRATRGDFQENIPEPADFDLVVCILWSRLGSRLHPGVHQRADGSAYASGTEYQFENAMESFKRSGRPELLVYRRTEMPLFPAEPREEMEARMRQWQALKSFCERWFRDSTEHTFTTAFNTYKDSGDFERAFEEHLKHLVEERLTQNGVGAEAAPRRERWWQGSPYRGLQVFEFEHEPIFFGRTKARDEVLGALRARWVEEKCPFVLIFGASGSGKSSLLRAGVLPWLVRPGVIEGVGMWRMALLRPADHAGDLIDGLASSLTGPKALPELLADGTTVEELARMLREEPKAITGLIKGALSQVAAEGQRKENLAKQPSVRVALGLDQLEEVFTLQERFGHESRQLFFHAIGALARSGQVWIVATLRSDFYNRCEEVPELVELKKNRGQYHLLPPTEIELSQMIRYPAEAAGVAFQEDPASGKLDEVIAREAQGEAGALPLLQYALDLLYHTGGADGVLTHEEYERVGRVSGAVANKAEQTFENLSTQERDSLDGVLRGLVTLGEGEQEVVTRKVARYEDLIRALGAKGLVDAFLEARLFTGDQDPAGHSTVMVAHEALLRVWPRVVTWVRDNRDFLRQRARLGQALEQWKTRNQHEDYLLARGLPLAEAESLLKQHEATLSEEEVAYIRASRARAQREELRRKKLRRAVMAGLSLLTLLALGAAATAIVQWWKQETMLKQASEQDYNVAHRLIEEGDTNLALNYLARSIRYDPKNELACLALGQVLLFNEKFPFKLSVAPLHHDGPLHTAVFSADGKFVVTASGDGTARVWEAATGKAIGEPLRHEGVISAAFSPDGKFVVTASGDGTARVWEAATGKAIGEPLRHEGTVISAAFSPDGKFVVTASGDNTARVWEAATGKAIGEPLRHEGAVRSAAFSPDGKFVLTASEDNTARVWEAATGKAIGEPLRHEGAVRSAAFSPDGEFVVTVSNDQFARVWEAAMGRPIGEPLRHERPVTSATFSPDGKFVVTASWDETARVWEAATGKAIGEPLRHEGAVRSAEFSPDRKFVITVSEDSTARVWEAATGKAIGEPLRHERTGADFSLNGEIVVGLWEDEAIAELLPQKGEISSAEFSPDGKHVVTASLGGAARVWEAAAGKAIVEPLRHERAVTSATFSPDGKFVVTASDDYTARVWEAAAGKAIGEPLQHRSPVISAEFSSDGKFVVTASEDNTARVWEAATGKAIGEPLRHEGDVRSAEFSPDGKFVVTASEDNTARVWEAATGKAIGEHLRHEGEVRSAEFSPDGKFVVTASWDNTARVWEAATGKAIGEPLRHEGEVRSAEFSPDGKLVVTASADETARVWEAATGKAIGGPLRQRGPACSAEFSPDGKLVVTASGDNTARVWDAATSKAIGRAPAT